MTIFPDSILPHKAEPNDYLAQSPSGNETNKFGQPTTVNQTAIAVSDHEEVRYFHVHMYISDMSMW